MTRQNEAENAGSHMPVSPGKDLQIKKDTDQFHPLGTYSSSVFYLSFCASDM